MKEKFIEAYIYCYGGSKKRAFEIYKKASKEYVEAIIESYEQDCGQSFYND